MRAEPRHKELPLEAVTLLGEGKLKDALKALRHSEGISRREARSRVDAHLVRDPLLRVQIETRERDARRRFFFWFVIVDLVIAAGIIYWFYFRGSV